MDYALHHTLHILLIRYVPREDATPAAFLNDLSLHLSELGELRIERDIIDGYVESIVGESEGRWLFLCLEQRQ